MRVTLVTATLCLSTLAWGQLALSVDKSAIGAVIHKDRSAVSIPARNVAGRPVKAWVTLAWLDQSGRASGEVERQETIPPGRSAIECGLALPPQSIWARLRYKIAPDRSDPGAFAPLSGILPLSHISASVFELRAEQPGLAMAGRRVTVHLQATHPVTHAAPKEVEWSVRAKSGGEPLEARVESIGSGLASVTFTPPDDRDVVAAVSARSGGFEAGLDVKVDVQERYTFSIQSDKPVYQPGQTVHYRAVLLDPVGKPVPKAKVDLAIRGPDASMRSVSVQSSEFGVVHDEWVVPAAAELGEYEITASYENSSGEHRIRISRYELPTFRVEVKPDRRYYLPGQKPMVEVKAVYLFGKPVANARVRIARRNGGNTVVEGVAGADGVFRAAIGIEQEQGSLNRGVPYLDAPFTASVTDRSSTRTEQRAFDLRATRDAIHVSVGDQQDLWAVTSYADGSPVSANVAIDAGGQTVRLRTNRYGVAKTAAVFDGPITVRADDGQGHTGSVEAFATGNGRIRIHAAKAIHRRGEPVTLRIDGDGDETVVVHALADRRLVGSMPVPLRAGKAEVVFPYREGFRGAVQFGIGNEAACAVVFPDDSGLSVRAAADRETYKPGDKATLRVEARTADGGPVRAAFGIAVVDQAVQEMERTRAELAPPRWFDCRWCSANDGGEVAGFRLSDIVALRRDVPVPEGLDLVAEYLVAALVGAMTQTFTGEDLSRPPHFSEIEAFGQKALSALERYFAATGGTPRTNDVLYLALVDGRNDSDPWGNPFHARFKVEGPFDTVELYSPGPDGRVDTADDIRAALHHRKWLLPILRASERILEKQGGYVCTAAGLAAILSNNGLLLATLRDPWGTPLRVHVQCSTNGSEIHFNSAGPDRRFGSSDDVIAGDLRGPFVWPERDRISNAIRGARSPAEARAAAEKAGLSGLRDPWGRPYRIHTDESATFVDRLETATVQDFGAPPAISRTFQPVKQRFVDFRIQSSGPDGVANTSDDFAVFQHPLLLSEEKEAKAPPAPKPALPKGSGAVAGTVRDQSGAVVPGAQILISTREGESRTVTDAMGEFRIDSLAPGVYFVETEAPGFQRHRMIGVPVASGAATRVEIDLMLTGLVETVLVNAEAMPLQTQAAMQVSSSPLPTPRVRDYFPETLYWTPELISGTDGAASITIPLADSITTWQAAVFASTLDGRMAESSASLRVFQPFFLDLNPPAVLTQGDRIELPAVLRNYLARESKASLEAATGSWGAIAGGAQRAVTVARESSAEAVWSITAARAADDARIRVVARSANDGDAIEKPLRVRPDGQEVARTAADFSVAKSTLTVPVPDSAISGATRAVVSVYPGTASLLLETARAILAYPRACAEQTISAGHASLLALRLGSGDDSVVKQAVEEMERFAPNGGVSYWRGGPADIAVTAHALVFLIAARDAVPVSGDKIEQLVDWLETQQQADGSWPTPGGRDEAGQKLLVTATAAQALARAKKAGIAVKERVLTGAYHHLARFASQTDEPYLLARFILAALDSGDAALLGDSVSRLRSLAREDRGALYWEIRTNTPFYGWGAGGVEETSALAVRALAAWRAVHPDAGLDTDIRRGATGLVRRRMAARMWSSPQSSLLSMMAIADAAPSLSAGGPPGGFSIRVNGRLVSIVPAPAAGAASGPVIVDVSREMAAGENRIEIQPNGGSGGFFAQLSTAYWLPWERTKPRTSSNLRLSVAFDRLEARRGDSISCRVKAERVAYRGYGMMLAEVALPPGARPDRASMRNEAISAYEILPDRVIFYLWPEAKGVDFSFRFTAALAGEMKSGASMAYDYANPEERTEVTPVRFTVR